MLETLFFVDHCFSTYIVSGCRSEFEDNSFNDRGDYDDGKQQLVETGQEMADEFKWIQTVGRNERCY